MRVLAFIAVLATAVVADPTKPASEYERVYDADHAIAGLPGFSVKRVKDAGHCGGYAIVISHDNKPPAGEDKLAELLLDQPPKMDLADFQKNLQTRMEWSAKHQAMTTELVKRYQKDFATGSPAAKLAAAARVVQIEFHGASTTLHAELPQGGDTPEAKAAFCDGLKLQSNHALESARSDIAICIQLAKGGPRGWWNDVCR
jgi:hypothetical protein